MLGKMIHPACSTNVSVQVLQQGITTFLPRPDFQQGEAKEERVFFPSFQRFQNWTTQRLNNLKVNGFQLNWFEQKSVTNLFVPLEIPLDGHRIGGGTCWFLLGGKGWERFGVVRQGCVGHSIIHW